MDGSPQSTLCSVLGKQGSSRGSTNCSSQVSSPPSAPAGTNRSDVAWDLLYVAADEVAKMRIFEERAGGYYQNRAILGATQKPSPISVPLKNHNPNTGFHSNRLYHQLQANQVSPKSFSHFHPICLAYAATVPATTTTWFRHEDCFSR